MKTVRCQPAWNRGRPSAVSKAPRAARLRVVIGRSSSDLAQGGEQKGHDAGEEADPEEQADQAGQAVGWICELVHFYLRRLDVFSVHLVTVKPGSQLMEQVIEAHLRPHIKH